MALFKWANQYSVGATVMDDHHKQLFGIMNKLYELEGIELKTNIESILGDLIHYTEYHFGEEERLLEAANYVGLPFQRSAHRDFVNKLKDYKEKARNNPDLAVFIANEAAMTAADWLKSHILKIDKNYESSLRSAGLI